MLGLIELRDDEDASNIYSTPALQSAQEEFEQRLNAWVRPKDECHTLNNNRVYVVLRDMSAVAELELAAAKLSRAFREPHQHLGRQLPLRICAGFAAFNNSNADMTLPLQQADAALRQAKRSDNLFELYSSETGAHNAADAELLEAIAEGLERGEFHLYFQPKIHAGFRNLTGAEALVRWHRSDKQVVMPVSFIDLAESNEVIRPLTWWSIKSAVACLARWPEDMTVAVNVSPALLLDDSVLSVVRDALEIYGVSASRLTLEVTEKIMIDNQDVVLRLLTRLRKIGVKIALDDFGTGFSSLSYFRDLPVDEIKIDQSFIGNMLTSKKDLTIVKAVIDLAHNFSLKVVGEGVESQAIADKLIEMRCDILQGYVFDMPLPLEKFEAEYRLRPA